VRGWFKSYGFAMLVLVALAGALWIAAHVAVPAPAPDFALRAEEIYRLEVGAAFFVAFYLVAMALVLALSGRGFAEFGSGGLKAADVIDRQALEGQQQSLAEQRRLDRQMRERLEEARVADEAIRQELKSHAQRLQRLERHALD
jgi:hypothetical protein